MIQGSWHRSAVLVLAVLVVAPAVCAEEAADAAPASDAASRRAELQKQAAANMEEVRADLKRSADFLAAQSSYSFRANVAFDVVQMNGQKLEFGSAKKITVRRPDRVRVDTADRDGDSRTLTFDGKQIAIDLPSENAYVAIEKPGTLDAAIDYLVEDLQTPAPLHDFLMSNFFAEIEDKLHSGFYVGEDTFGKTRCEHLALRSSKVDVQIWIEVGDRPLPCRMVITYPAEQDSPQFKAHFIDWDLAPRTPDKMFTFTPPDGAEKLSIQTAIQDAREEVEVQ